jgi:hypothetical protein
MDKALKVIYLIIGICLLFVLPVLVFQIVKELRFWRGYDYPDQSLIVSDEQKKAVKQGKMIQGIFYDNLETIPGTGIKVLPVYAKTFSSPVELQEYENDVLYDKKLNLLSARGSGHSGYVNMIFLDSNYVVTNTLLKSKGFITRHTADAFNHYEVNSKKIPPAKRRILYNIAFRDSNKDGYLNSDDETDLYISRLDGSDLRQVTKNMDVTGYWAGNDYEDILIEYHRRDNIPDELKKKYFARYIVSENRLEELSGLHKTILDLEKNLMLDTLTRL